MLDDYAMLIREGHVYVASRHGVVAGILVLIAQSDAMLLDNVAVAPEAQGTGLGRLMLSFAEQKAREAGYRFIKLYTNEAMVENNAYRLCRNASRGGKRVAPGLHVQVHRRHC